MNLFLSGVRVRSALKKGYRLGPSFFFHCAKFNAVYSCSKGLISGLLIITRAFPMKYFFKSFAFVTIFVVSFQLLGCGGADLQSAKLYRLQHNWDKANLMLEKA